MYILPTIRINNGQYRGKLSVTEVMRALCAAFVKGKEPPACLKVKEDECRPGSVGESYCANNKCAPAVIELVWKKRAKLCQVCNPNCADLDRAER